MNKYFVLYRIPVETMQKWMQETPQDQIQAQTHKMMEDINAWMAKNAAQIIDKGQPLGKSKRVSANGTEDVKNDLNFYQIVKAESHEAAAKMVADNPHLRITDSFLDVMEIPSRGM